MRGILEIFSEAVGEREMAPKCRSLPRGAGDMVGLGTSPAERVGVTITCSRAELNSFFGNRDRIVNKLNCYCW